MRIDLETYSARREYIHSMYESKYKGDTNRAIGSLAAITMVPCIVIAFYLAEIEGFTPDLIKSINSLIDFYGYSEIQNKPENSPV